MADYGTRSFSPVAAVGGVAGILFGVLVGYAVAVQRGAPAGPVPVRAATAATAPAPATTPVLDERELQTWRDILKNDPKNVRAATEVANRLYDAGRYADALPYYEQAYALEPADVSLSTDLATTLWYAGRIDPTHPQTLFNLGIVRRDGKQDLKGAVEAWERLVTASPSSPEGQRAVALLEQARQQLATVTPTSAR
jgi:cytochrome c-type biogenesis protein CcmH/NrfG